MQRPKHLLKTTTRATADYLPANRIILCDALFPAEVLFPDVYNYSDNTHARRFPKCWNYKS